MLDLAYRWPLEKAIETSIEATKLHSLTNKKMLSHAEFRDVARATLGRSQQAAE
jgi:hypothetical protein